MNSVSSSNNRLRVTLLTGGGDRPYAFGLTSSLASHGADLDVVAGDELDEPELRAKDGVRLLNLRGSSRSDVSALGKAVRVLAYYAKLIAYSAKAEPSIFHILWNNRFEWFDRTLLMLYYHALGKKIILTLHNVNASRRDGKDTRINRLTLSVQYRLADHIFVHTAKMKQELMSEFKIPQSRISVIPFGINNSVPNSGLKSDGARQRLGLSRGEKTVLFYGNIAPYKGLEYLIAAFRELATRDQSYRLIVAGRPKNCEEYWAEIQEMIHPLMQSGTAIVRAEFIPDEETEVYFKAADVVVLPYTHIYQSGVLFLAYSFGLPVLAADVGSLKDDIVEGKTGYVFAPADVSSLKAAIFTYFENDLYRDLPTRRTEIQSYAAERNSWDTVASLTLETYINILRKQPGQNPASQCPEVSLDMKTSQ
jgi:D-inositol-3-phosphate glycosyltransferase